MVAKRSLDGGRALLGGHRDRRFASQRADPRRVLRRRQRAPGYSSVGVLDDPWHHVAVWYDRDSGITISVDGARLHRVCDRPDVSNTGTVEIGKAPTHNYFKGDLDEVALYTGLVPAERMAAHRAAAVG